MPLASPLLAFAIVRLCFAQFYFENHQSVLGSPTPMVRPIFTLPHALGVQLGGGGVTLQTVCRVKAVNSSCNLGKADSAPLPAPRSRTRTPPAPPAEIRFIGHMAWRKRCDRAFASWSLFDGTVLPSRTSRNRLPADCRYGVTTGDRARDCPSQSPSEDDPVASNVVSLFPQH